MEDGADRPLRRERVRHRVEIGLVEFPNAGSSSRIDLMSSSPRTFAVRDRTDFTFAEFRTAHGFVKANRRPRYSFISITVFRVCV